MASGIRVTNTILDKIVARKIQEVADLRLSNTSPLFMPRDLITALRQETVALIAEIKHASPSKGVLIKNFDPARLASSYAQGGAAAISVLTDLDFFQGSLDDLREARASASVPVLRKDFLIDVRQVLESRRAGADGVLLIVAILDDARLHDLFAAARGCDIAALVEVHSPEELDRALKLAPNLIGINNRDLRTFHVDLNVTRRLAPLALNAIPDVTLVAESGIFTPAHVESMAASGAHAILVGESIVTSPDIVGKVRALSGVTKVKSS